MTAEEISDMLADAGADTIGPVAFVGDAEILIATEDRIDGAILDVNLHGEPVYPLADLIAARDVPFVFVTGYGPDGIDSRFAHVPVLQKPIEREALQTIFQPNIPPGALDTPLPAAAAG